MAAYKKPKISSKVNTLVGYEATFTDGRTAFEAFEAKKTIKGKVGTDTVLIPFHAVKVFTKTIASEDAEKADPYCE